MAEELNQEKLTVCTRQKLTSVQLKNSTIIAHQTNKISKILTVVACASVGKVESSNAEAKFGVNVRYEALVCLDNGEITTILQTDSTSTTVENQVIGEHTNVDVFCVVLDVSSSLSNGEITVNSLIGCEVYISNHNLCIKQAKRPENVFTKESEIKLTSHKCSVSHSSTVMHELDLQGKVNKLIFCGFTGCSKQITPNNDYFTLNGQMTINLMCEYEDGQIKNIVKDIDFSEEIECKGLTSDDIVQTRLCFDKPCSTNLITDQNSNNLVNIELPYTINAQVYQQTTREFIIDAYSTEKEVNLTLESFEQNEFLETKFVEDKIISTFTLTEDAPRVERILLSNGENISVVTAFAKDGEIVLEGIANIGTIYYSEDDDGNKVLNSVVIDVPYSLSVQAPLVKSGDNVEVEVSLGEVIVKNKKGRELEVIANINISYNINRPSVFAISTEINFGEQKQEKDYALEIYVAKENQTLWDIAKYLNISQENLLNQNPEVVLPLNAGDKLVAYHGGKNIE